MEIPKDGVVVRIVHVSEVAMVVEIVVVTAHVMGLEVVATTVITVAKVHDHVVVTNVTTTAQMIDTTTRTLNDTLVMAKVILIIETVITETETQWKKTHAAGETTQCVTNHHEAGQNAKTTRDLQIGNRRHRRTGKHRLGKGKNTRIKTAQSFLQNTRSHRNQCSARPVVLRLSVCPTRRT